MFEQNPAIEALRLYFEKEFPAKQNLQFPHVETFHISESTTQREIPHFVIYSWASVLISSESSLGPLRPKSLPYEPSSSRAANIIKFHHPI